MSRTQPYSDIVIAAPVTIPYERTSERSAHYFIGSAYADLIQASGGKQNIDGLAISSFSLAPDSASSLTQYFDVTLRYLEQVPFGGASGIIAMRRAAAAIHAGQAEIVACIGGDTAPPNSFRDIAANFSNFSQIASYPYGGAGPNAPFSLITQHYMDAYGAMREDFANLCISQRYNASKYKHGLFKTPMTIDDYLSARQIAGPLHLFDCVMPCAGAEGFLVMRAERAKNLSLPYADILSSEEIHNAFGDDEIQHRLGHELIRDQLFSTTGLEPDDIDLVETYDDYPVISMMQLEGLGFCNTGQGPAYFRDVDTTFDGGGLPHNTSGGQLSCGQAGAGGGFLGLVEALRQVTGQALGNQVESASLACISGYGMINYDRGLAASAAIIRGNK